MISADLDTIIHNEIKIGIGITKYAGSHTVQRDKFFLDEHIEKRGFSFMNSVWFINSSFSSDKDNQDTIYAEITFKLVKGNLDQADIFVDLTVENWKKENYVLVPAAVYNGNRFKVSDQQVYPPMLRKKDELGVDIPTLITDIPRLNLNPGLSKIKLRTGDMATPAIGFYCPTKKRGFFMLANQKTILGDSGIEIEENDDRTEASIKISAPAVRHDNKYSMCTTKEISDDIGHDFCQNDEITFRFKLYFFDCKDIPSLYDYFFKIRKDILNRSFIHNQISFSKVWEIVEKKYNERNWIDEYCFYKSSEAETSIYRQWQTGWVGGAISTYAALFVGNELSQNRAWKTLDFFFKKMQASTGFFYGIYCDGRPYGDHFYDKENINWLLLRKNADVMYFLTKQFMLIEKIKLASIPDYWLIGLQKLCDAFVRLWKKYEQFGQFIDIQKEEIIIGGTASSGIAPAGLVIAGQYLQNEEYIEVAKNAAEYYYENFTKKGITNGGPGEICQCPDSESAFGLLESYIEIYEVTGDKKWLYMAEDSAKQCATWCVSYDYEFPQESLFKKLGMHTSGAVWANVQNKHAAPGICTLSGVSLFKLYRATGNRLYLELIQEIAHNLPQYVSREDRFIGISWNNSINNQYNLEGRIDERINMSDWEGKQNIGAIPGGSCWCEVSSMLTYVEIPGVYIQKDTGFACAIDHVDVEVIENSNTNIIIVLKNATAFTAKVKLLAENTADMKNVLGQNALLNCTEITIKPYLSEKIILYKNV